MSVSSLQQHIDARAAKMRAKAAATRTRDTWESVTRENAARRLAFGTVLAFDQTLSSCGIATVIHDDLGLRVSWTHLVRPSADEQVGFVGTYTKAHDLRVQLDLLQERTCMVDCVDHVVHEMPSTGGHRVESSLLAAYVVRELATDRGHKATMVANASMRALLVPPEQRADRSKVPVREAVDALFPAFDDRGVGPWNEHTRDAVGLAVTHLHHLKIAK